MKSAERVMLRNILASAVSRVTPLEQTDMILLIEVARASWRAVSARGAFCVFGCDGEKDGRRLCVPDSWRQDEQAYHDAACSHCPLYKEHRGGVNG